MTIDIVGCGAAVQLLHLAVLRRLQEEQGLIVRGCFDLNPDNARSVGRMLGAARHGHASQLDDLDEVDAALVATTPDSHAHYVGLYVTAGKHVLVEKPFVPTAREAEVVCNMAQSRGARVLVGHFRRFYPSVTAARQLIRAGGLTGIRRVEATEGIRWSWPTRSAYITESPYGGVIYDTGSHLLDTVLYVLGLDLPTSAAHFRIGSNQKWPAKEPSQDCSASIEIADTAGRSIEICLRISRTEALAGMVSVYADNGTLLVPTSISSQADLIIAGQRFGLAVPSLDPIPTNAEGCFLLEHMELMDAARGREEKGILDCQSFVLLTELLEALAAS